ncbi:MAG: hypothetical protein U0270_44225 [Labilithrix sp.]
MKAIRLYGLLALLFACGNKGGGAAEGGAPAAKAGGSLGPANATVVGHAKAIAEGCTINVEYGQATSCKNGVDAAAKKYVSESKPADFVSTLVPLMTQKDDPKLSAAAVGLFYDEIDGLTEAGKRANARPEVVEALLAYFKEQPGVRGNRLARGVAHLATMAKMSDKLFEAAAASPSKTARESVYRNAMAFGRLDVFPKVKEAKPDVLAGALAAPRQMAKPTDAEKAAVCPWAKESLGSTDGETASAAGNTMVWCRGAYIDALLAEAEKRLAAKQYKDPFAAVMREPCFDFIGKSPTDDATCEKVYTFLEKASNDPGVDDATRGLALWNIYYQRRDAKTLAIMRKYEKSPNKEVAKRAGEAIKSLTETYKIKG